MRLSVIVPAFNEERSVGAVIGRIFAETSGRLECEVIVVDDGSTDRTSDVARSAAPGDERLKVIRHSANLGKGAAVRTALRHARGDVCLIQDADLEYDVSDYPELLAAIGRGADVAYGSRFLARRWPQGMRLANYVANRVLTLAANWLFQLAITDEATCYKVFRTSLLRSLCLQMDRFEFCPEVTAKLGLRRVRIVEVPIRYRARDVESGKKVRWLDGVRALATLFRFWLVARASRLLDRARSQRSALLPTTQTLRSERW